MQRRASIRSVCQEDENHSLHDPKVFLEGIHQRQTSLPPTKHVIPSATNPRHVFPILLVTSKTTDRLEIGSRANMTQVTFYRLLPGTLFAMVLPLIPKLKDDRLVALVVA